MLILSRNDIKQVLEPVELFEALSDGFQMLAENRWNVPLRTVIEMPSRGGVALFMPSYCDGLSAAGLKLVTVMKNNPAKNLPLIYGSYVYVSAETGEILSLMDAEHLTCLRTAVTSALVTDLLGKSDGRVLAVFGTGVQAWSHVEVFTKLFSIAEVLVYGYTPELSEEFAERVERQLRKPARGAVLGELKRADVICTCTTNETPLFELKDLQNGAHINAIGAYRPAAREIGSDIVSKAAVVVDTYEGALNESGEIVMALNEGAIARDSIYASIAQLVSKVKPAPVDRNQLTLFKSLGMALEDLVAADLAYRKARERGVGTEVRL